MDELMVMGQNMFEENENKTMYCSFKAQTHEDKAKLYNMMNTPGSRLAEHINEVIQIKDVFMEQVTMINKETGESTVGPRIVIMDIEGNTYSSVSFGLLSAIRKLVMIFGEPTWENGISVKVKQITKDKNNILTLEVV